MRLREIPVREWGEFLDKLAREHRAWLASVDCAGRVEAREQPLQSISARDGIDIHIGKRAIHVDEPRAVRVEETPEGAAQALVIDDAALLEHLVQHLDSSLFGDLGRDPR